MTKFYSFWQIPTVFKLHCSSAMLFGIAPLLLLYLQKQRKFQKSLPHCLKKALKMRKTSSGSVNKKFLEVQRIANITENYARSALTHAEKFFSQLFLPNCPLKVLKKLKRAEKCSRLGGLFVRSIRFFFVRCLHFSHKFSKSICSASVQSFIFYLAWKSWDGLNQFGDIEIGVDVF